MFSTAAENHQKGTSSGRAKQKAKRNDESVVFDDSSKTTPVHVRKEVAKAHGVSEQTYDRLKKVVQAAEAEPEKYGDLPKKMDETNVNSAFRELRRRQENDGKPQPTPPKPGRKPKSTGKRFIKDDQLRGIVERVQALAAELQSYTGIRSITRDADDAGGRTNNANSARPDRLHPIAQPAPPAPGGFATSNRRGASARPL